MRCRELDLVGAVGSWLIPCLLSRRRIDPARRLRVPSLVWGSLGFGIWWTIGAKQGVNLKLRSSSAEEEVEDECWGPEGRGCWL